MLRIDQDEVARVEDKARRLEANDVLLRFLSGEVDEQTKPFGIMND
jgi:hypothetical protein